MTSPTFDNAWTMMEQVLKDWGLESLSDVVRGMLVNGDSTEVIPLKLRETNEYKQRFAGNEDRRKAGLPVLSEAEYLATENSYRQVMRDYGLPQGFYDSPDDFRKFIAADVSPQEMQNRVTLAAERYLNADQFTKAQFNRAGMTPGDTIAAILDPTVAEPLLRQKLTSFAIAGEAARAFNDPDHVSLDRAMDLAQAGVTQDQARQGFGELAGRQTRDLELSKMYNTGLTQTSEENEALLGQRNPAREKTLETEKAQFAQGYMGQSGGLSQVTTGQY